MDKCVEKPNKKDDLESTKENKYVRYPKYNQLIDCLPMAIFIFEDNIVTNCNKAAVGLMGFANKKELIGINLFEILPKLQDDSEHSLKKANEYMQRVYLEKKIMFKWILKKKDGRKIQCEVTLTAIKSKNKKLTCAVLKDVTEKKELQRALEERQQEVTVQESYFHQLFENSPEAIAMLDIKGRVMKINKSFERMFHYTIEEILGKVINNIICSKEYYNDSITLMEKAKKGEVVRAETVRVTKEGEGIYVSLLNYPILQKDMITGFYAIYSDISERKRCEEQIKTMVFTDALTSLYNRTYFVEKLNEEINTRLNKNSKMALLFLDIDNFKKINDVLGHVVGDKALIYFGQKLKKIINSRGIVSRMGGDEFSILLPNATSEEEALIIANEILRNFKKLSPVDKHLVYITPSIGISIYPDDGEDLNELIKNADIAMYKAKDDSGGKIQLYSPEFYKQIRTEFLIDNYLKEAEIDKEFYLDYQPIINASSGKIVGAEALLRWIQPTLGLVNPDTFIKIAERNGMIFDIGKWVLEKGCQTIKELMEKGINSIFISINVSVIQLQQEGFGDLIKQVLEDYDIPANMIIIEITETCLADNLDKINCEVKKIREIGVRVAIDDFGTGYSSLDKIKRLNISELKIDKIFINDISEKEDNSIVTAIISIAKNLNMKVIAEGVETIEQLKFLNTHNCDMIQGYYFSKPVSKEKLRDMIKGLERGEI